ncbi:MAG: glycosyltransferase family 39 protein [Candidatus Omnitrophota bacterium]
MKNLSKLLLAIVIIATFFIRFNGFTTPHNFTFDEAVYSTLGKQLQENIFDYNTIKLYESQTSHGRNLPAHYNRHLFVHPPVFSLLIALSYTFFGVHLYSAAFVSIFFGLMLIVLAFLFGKVLFDEKVGVYAALFMAIEPISWITSQKIWMETTLAFFMGFSLYCFYRGIKRYHPVWIIAGGFIAGIATLTKYPGVLLVGVLFLYAILVERWLFSKKAFIFSLCLPFIMLIPWVCWNFIILGSDFLSTLHYTKMVGALIVRYFWLAIVLPLGYFGIKEACQKSEKICLITRIISIVFLFFVVRGALLHCFDPNYLPRSGWEMGMFRNEPKSFYLGRLLELSPVYLFSFLGLIPLLFSKRYFKERLFLFLYSGIVLMFFTLWRGFQSRYILSAVVPLVVIAVQTLFYLSDKISCLPGKYVIPVRVLFCGMIIFCLFKTLILNFSLAMSNNICYF